ncbi:hypothetical protein [Streptomyces sp. bgisy022]|uniref:hypothetical protein n=1 Tax=Streptomyces sp. bgisy022 TaxID=3413769 RepID=UPI003D75E9DE
MTHHAVDTVEAAFWAAMVSAGLMAACAAYLTITTGYWAAVACLRAARTLRAYLHYRHHTRCRRQQIARERAQMTRLRDAIDTAPLIPTQPGTDNDLLNQCWDAWNTDTQPRKENP